MIRGECDQVLSEVLGAQESHGPTTLDRVFLSQRPVTAVSSVTVDGTLLDDFTWTRWGTLMRSDGGVWLGDLTEVVYDHGYADDSDEMADIKAICIKAAIRALSKETGDFATFSEDIVEARGFVPQVFLTNDEKARLRRFGPVPVG
jgi:hypothetical protein